MTKREMYDVIGTVFAGLDNEYSAEVIAFTEKEKAALDAKNEKAKARAAAKRAEGDALKNEIAGLLGDTPKTVNDIVAEIGGDITPAKVIARATQLVKAGIATKETVKFDGRNLVGYVKA